MNKIVLVGINCRYTHSCLALFYLRNELVKKTDGLEIEIVQYTINDPYYQMLVHLSSSDADCYFLSTAIWNSDVSVKLTRDLLTVSRRNRVVVGGPQAEIVAAAVADKRCSVVVGEIEGIDPGFYKQLQNGELQQTYICARAGKGYSSPYQEQDFTTHLQNRHIYYESSRGCPFSCTYCLSASQTGVFHKELDLVDQELRQILKHNPKVLRFVDRTFNDNPGRALAIWKMLLRHPSDTVFHFEISPLGFNEEMYAFLEDIPVGKFQFEIGIQSTNRATLKAIRRPMEMAVVQQTISRLRSLGTIHLHVDLILGLPHETETSFLRSFSEVFAMNPHHIQMGLLKILPNTPICHTAPEFGYVYSTSTPYSVLANRWLDHRALQELFWFSECVESFLNNRYFVSLWKYLRENDEDISGFFLHLLDISRKHDLFFSSPTQKFLCFLLLEAVKKRVDQQLIFEFLRYDWLRCGHRFLPPLLEKASETQTSVLRREIFHWLHSGEKSDEQKKRDSSLLKKGIVLEFSGMFMERLGYPATKGRHFLCFTKEQEQTLYRFSKVVPFSLPDQQSQ